MVLVILGHIVLGSVHENLIRYAIYAFHMPLFIALSGYLINTPSLQRQTFGATMQRYWHRMLKPFVLAFAVFTGVLAVHAWQESRLDSVWLVSSLLTPYYHLWFVPTLVIWVVGLAIILKLRIPLWFALIFSVLSSVLWASIGADQLPKLIALLNSKKVVYFFSFFLFGVMLRAWQESGHLSKLNRPPTFLIALVALTAIVYMQGLGAIKTPVKAFAWYGLNVALFLLSLVWINLSKTVIPEVGLVPCEPRKMVVWSRVAQQLETLGRLSLPIYLWHVLPLFLLFGFGIHETHTLIYYTLSSVSCLIIVWMVSRYEQKWRFADRWFYGNPSGST